MLLVPFVQDYKTRLRNTRFDHLKELYNPAFSKTAGYLREFHKLNLIGHIQCTIIKAPPFTATFSYFIVNSRLKSV